MYMYVHFYWIWTFLEDPNLANLPGLDIWAPQMAWPLGMCKKRGSSACYGDQKRMAKRSEDMHIGRHLRYFHTISYWPYRVNIWLMYGYFMIFHYPISLRDFIILLHAMSFYVMLFHAISSSLSSWPLLTWGRPRNCQNLITIPEWS